MFDFFAARNAPMAVAGAKAGAMRSPGSFRRCAETKEND